MFTENPNRGKRRASRASRASIRTSVPRSARTASGEPIVTGVTVYRVDPAHLRRVGTERAVASAERAAAGKRAAAGSAVVARNVTRRSSLPERIAAGMARAERIPATPPVATHAERVDSILHRAERAEQRGNFALAAALLERAAMLDVAA